MALKQLFSSLLQAAVEALGGAIAPEERAAVTQTFLRECAILR